MKHPDVDTAARAVLDRLDDGPRECARKPDSRGRFDWHPSFEALIGELRDALGRSSAATTRNAE